MKKLIVLLVIVLFGSNILAGNREEKPFMTHTFPSASIKALEATTERGAITVNGDAGSEVVVEMYVSDCNCETRSRKRSVKDIKQTIEEDYTIDVRVEGGKLYAVAKPKKSNQNVLSISFKISAPKQVNSDLRTNVGSIRIADLTGVQDFRTGSGSLNVENVAGKISGTTSVGAITVTNSKDVVKLTTGSGSITAKNCSGQIILKTSVGAIILNDLNGDVNLTTGSGSLSVENVSGKIIGSTAVGSVTVTNSKDVVDLKTGSGRIAAKNCNGEIKLGTSVGAIVLNDIDGDVNITTGSGSITVENVSGKITGSTSVGSIIVNKSKGLIDLKTGSGSITADKVEGVFKTETKVGSVNLKGMSGSVEAKNGSGSMTIEMQSVSDYVKLSCTGPGTLNLTLPAGKGYNMKASANVDVKTSGLNNFSGNLDKNKLEGTVANGGPEIDVKAYRVNLTLK